jgi:hypothetical protein
MSFSALTDQPSTVTLPGDGWYPDLSMGEFQRVYRLPAEYAEALVEDHLGLARLWAMRQLQGWRAAQEAAGFASLDAVPVFGMAGEATRLFKRAVFCHAKALLLGQFATVERREAAREDAKEGPDVADRFYAWAHDAIADLRGRGRIDADLV